MTEQTQSRAPVYSPRNAVSVAPGPERAPEPTAAYPQTQIVQAQLERTADGRVTEASFIAAYGPDYCLSWSHANLHWRPSVIQQLRKERSSQRETLESIKTEQFRRSLNPYKEGNAGVSNGWKIRNREMRKHQAPWLALSALGMAAVAGFGFVEVLGHSSHSSASTTSHQTVEHTTQNTLETRGSSTTVANVTAGNASTTSTTFNSNTSTSLGKPLGNGTGPFVPTESGIKCDGQPTSVTMTSADHVVINGKPETHPSPLRAMARVSGEPIDQIPNGDAFFQDVEAYDGKSITATDGVKFIMVTQCEIPSSTPTTAPGPQTLDTTAH